MGTTSFYICAIQDKMFVRYNYDERYGSGDEESDETSTVENV